MSSDKTDADELHLDPLVPADVARKAEHIGVQKTRLEFWNLLVLSLLGGAFIAFGAVFATTVQAGTGDLPFGVIRLLAGSVFCLGLVLVVVSGAELFTGNTVAVMALASRKVTLREVLRAWTIVYVGNFLGSVGTAVLVFLSGQYRLGGGAVGEVALGTAANKAALPFDEAFFLGVLCNLLVCLALWMSLAARSTTDKVFAVIFPISAFVAAGFEHSVANMYFLSIGLLIKNYAPADLWPQLGMARPVIEALTWGGVVRNLVPVTLGNIVGGGVLVWAVYWFVYLRPSAASARKRAPTASRPGS